MAAYQDRLFVVNALAGSVSVLDYSDPTAIAQEFSLSSDGVANSVAVRADGLGIIAFEAPVKTDPGHLVFFDANATDAASAVLGQVTVGALPDMVSISADGAYAVVANEGEPADDFSVDPEGSVSIVSLPKKAKLDKKPKIPTQKDVRTADFHAFEAGGSKTLAADVRVFGPAPHGADLPVSRNLEPEYIAIDGGTAYAALQEANAIAVVDLTRATVTEIMPLGFKDLSVAGNGIDPSDRDPNGAPTFQIRTFAGLHGVYMPDGLNAYSAGGQTYLVTANEGDAREWGDYVGARAREGPRQERRRAGLRRQPARRPHEGRRSRTSQRHARARASTRRSAATTSCTRSADARSRSGPRTVSRSSTRATRSSRSPTRPKPAFFNSSHTTSALENRSDDKGPEPENLSIGQVDGRTYAFIGFERVGGVAVFDITEPAASRFVTYVNNRDFSVSVEDADDPAAVLSQAGDLGPEGVAFIPAASSPTGAPLLAVANEVSGTTTLFSIAGALTP